jgi:hypothetical protein
MYEKVFQATKYIFLTYELIENKFQKINELILDSKIHPNDRIQLTYIPSSKVFYFNYIIRFNDDMMFSRAIRDCKKLFLYDYKKGKIKIINKIYLQKYQNKRKYKVDEYFEHIIINENEINEQNALKILKNKICEYWHFKDYYVIDYVMSENKINKSLYIITYDKLNIVYLFEVINEKLKLIKLCNFNFKIKDIQILDEYRFLVLYYDKKKETKSMI